ncbi:MAG TPA: hypothetical protein VK675_00150 [Candidatus Paceibacterota bacterium]|nr:hypothetical protein [Candidatus Paceibacterota bacterium]
MLPTFCGVILFFIPFVLIFNFRDKVEGFLYVFTSLIALHILVALFTQVFHVFSYGLIIGIHFLISSFCLIFFFYKQKYFSRAKLNSLVLISFAIIGFELLSVHYFYTGTVSETERSNVVFRDFYAYPFYSDEWVGVSLADYSIENKSLPFANPLWHDTPFANGLVVFYSFISELFLLFNLAPLTGWSLFAIMNGLLISLLLYLLLRVNNVNNFSSSIATLSVPWIVNGTNLPGIWFLTPFIFSLSLFITFLICLSKREFLLGMTTSIICLLLYPPIIVLVFPTLLFYILKNKISLYYLFSIGAVGVIIIAILSINFGYSRAIGFVYSSLIRPNLDGGIVSMPFWIVLPILLIPIILFGLIIMIKKKSYTLLVPIIIGLFFWFLYAFVSKIIILEQSRVVAITSVLLMIPIGFGIESIVNLIKNQKTVNFIKVLFILAFVVAALFYPGSNRWSKLVLKIKTDNGYQDFFPSAPVTRYLQSDDLKFFSSFSKKRFLSLPWKGLVIGTATHNYPLDSKDSTITNKFVNYAEFMQRTCEEKSAYARDFKIEYVYSDSFDCPSFEELGSSQEGFHLYRPISHIVL